MPAFYPPNVPPLFPSSRKISFGAQHTGNLPDEVGAQVLVLGRHGGGNCLVLVLLVVVVVVVVQCAYVFAVGGIRDTTLGGGMMLEFASGRSTSEAGARRERVCRSLW